MRLKDVTAVGAILAAVVLVLLPGTAGASDTAQSCNAPMASQSVAVSGRPFVALPSADGCYVFVSLVGTGGVGTSGTLVVFQRTKAGLTQVASVDLGQAPTAIALTSDGKTLVAASGDGIAAIDVSQLIAGAKGALLGRLDDGGDQAINVAITPDDRFVFVSDERSQTISVIDLRKAMASSFGKDAVVGQIPVGQAPVGLAFSADGSTLFATSESMPLPDWPGGCAPEQGEGPEHKQGVLFAIDVRRAETYPPQAVVARTNAACNPVRVVLGPAGLLYVTARGSNLLLAFDAAKLTAGTQSLVASIDVGTSPVGLVATADARVIAADSGRFARNGEDQTLSVVDVSSLPSGAAKVLGTVPAGIFPRELRLSSDGKTLYVTNFGSDAIGIYNLADMPARAP